MAVINIKLPSKKRNRVTIVRDEDMINKENFIRKQHLEIVYPHLKKLEEEKKLAKKRREEERARKKEEERLASLKAAEELEQREKQRIIDEINIGFRPVFSQEFVFSNTNRLIEIDLNKVSEPSLPLGIVKEEVQKSYDKGVNDGLIQSKATFQIEVEKYQKWIRSIESVTQNLEVEYKSEIERIKGLVVDLSVMVAKHLLESEFLNNSDLVIKQVKKTIDSLEEDKIFKLHLHPSDVAILTKVQSTLLNDEHESNSIIVTADVSVDKGGCKLETSAGFIDAKISSQLENISKSLRNTYSKYTVENQINNQIVKNKEDSQESTELFYKQEFELKKREELGDDAFRENFDPNIAFDYNSDDYDDDGYLTDNQEIIESGFDTKAQDLSEDIDKDSQIEEDTTKHERTYDDDINDLIFG